MGTKLICAITDNQSEAERLIHALIQSGVDPNEISVLSTQEEYSSSPQAEGSLASPHALTSEFQDPLHFKEKRTDRALAEREHKLEEHTHASEGATAGAATGGVIGGALGLLAGIGVIALPGIAPLIAAGPLIAALSGIGAGGTLGSVLGALIGAEIPDKETHIYETSLKEGSTILAINSYSEKQAEQIKQIFRNGGAKEISAINKTKL